MRTVIDRKSIPYVKVVMERNSVNVSELLRKMISSGEWREKWRVCERLTNRGTETLGERHIREVVTNRR